MSQRLLADVLWDAANKYLPIEGFSCHATAYAMHGRRWRCAKWRTDQAARFLKSLGCNQDISGFKDVHDEEEATGVRYMWLLLAMHVAEDEGIELP